MRFLLLTTLLWLGQLCYATTSVHARAPAGTAKVYSAMQPDLVDHVYTINKTELNFLISYYGFKLEGKDPDGTTTGFIHTSPQPSTVPLFRLYAIGRTDHLLTTSTEERDLAVKRLGYHLEGVLGYAYTEEGEGLVPFYRLHNSGAHDHYYTSSKEESEDAARNGWVNEGIVGYLFAS
ncbi:hypothetical protein Hypma_003876 [Hypsizygus marmoreus]|uniref:DUF5648 domain-containing protein n=1 Tax=Hypsizygus marmoreus TaxID=39966 RepID=A0A369K214_HYPMA|nr:hypothetical protein Hypma_003876 [Hypsizygus marmoreus]